MNTCSTCAYYELTTSSKGWYSQGQCKKERRVVDQMKLACKEWLEKEEFRIENKGW